MAVVVGIDEAGYGPVLGPLVVAAAVFEVPDADCGAAAPDLWHLLSRGVARAGQGADGRVCIADSKWLHQGNGRLERLERNVLATCPLPMPLEFKPFAQWLGIPEIHLADGEPWYARGYPELPVETDIETVRAARLVLLRALGAAGIALRGVIVNLTHPWRFNRLVTATGNKASVLWSLSAELLERIIDGSSGRPVSVTMDKHGGRTYYAGLLQQTFPLVAVEAVCETPAESRYRLGPGAGGTLDLTVREKADVTSLPVALASMYAKYVREVCMRQFNVWWQARAGDVAPTAGYWTDYQRWAAEMQPWLAALDLPPEKYVRSR